MRHVISSWLLLGAVGCGALPGNGKQQANGPSMRPGENCNGCHSFSVAGSVFPAGDSTKGSGVGGAVVHVTDASGAQLSLSSNGAGNFYTSASLSLPLIVSVTANGREAKMASKVTTGACGSCHGISQGLVATP